MANSLKRNAKEVELSIKIIDIGRNNAHRSTWMSVSDLLDALSRVEKPDADSASVVGSDHLVAALAVDSGDDRSVVRDDAVLHFLTDLHVGYVRVEGEEHARRVLVHVQRYVHYNRHSTTVANNIG